MKECGNGRRKIDRKEIGRGRLIEDVLESEGRG